MLSVIMLNVVMLIAMMPSAALQELNNVKLSITMMTLKMLNVIMLIALVLSAIIPSVATLRFVIGLPVCLDFSQVSLF
jgi:hypothetical protein